MGCCFSGEEEAKETELARPQAAESIRVKLKKQGMFDADYDVLDVSKGEPQIWMLIDTVGGMFTPSLKYYLKYRAAGEETSSILGAAEIHGKDNEFSYKITDVDRDVDVDFDSDRDDDWSDDGDSDREFEVCEVETTTKIKAKWKLEKECRFFADKEMQQEIGSLKVKAKGKYKRKTKKEMKVIQYEDEEGHTRTRNEESIDIKHKTKVKKFHYKMKVHNTKVNLDVKKTSGGSFWNSNLEWRGVTETGAELFKIVGDGRNCVVETGEGTDPHSTLLAAFAVACKFDPAEVQGHAQGCCAGRIHA